MGNRGGEVLVIGGIGMIGFDWGVGMGLNLSWLCSFLIHLFELFLQMNVSLLCILQLDIESLLKVF